MNKKTVRKTEKQAYKDTLQQLQIELVKLAELHHHVRQNPSFIGTMDGGQNR